MHRERVAAVLDGTIADLQSTGWCQGTYRDPEGRVCAARAIHNQYLRGFSSDEVHGAFNAFIRAAEIPLGAIPVWNDEPGRTVEDVVLALKKARENVLTGSIA